MPQLIEERIMTVPYITDLITEINILENSCCIINLTIISKLVLGLGKNLVSSGHQNEKKEYFPLTFLNIQRN